MPCVLHKILELSFPLISSLSAFDADVSFSLIFIILSAYYIYNASNMLHLYGLHRLAPSQLHPISPKVHKSVNDKTSLSGCKVAENVRSTASLPWRHQISWILLGHRRFAEQYHNVGCCRDFAFLHKNTTAWSALILTNQGFTILTNVRLRPRVKRRAMRRKRWVQAAPTMYHPQLGQDSSKYRWR
jgi:hypothetical protein